MKKDQKLLIAEGALLFLLEPSLLKGSNTGAKGPKAAFSNILKQFKK